MKNQNIVQILLLKKNFLKTNIDYKATSYIKL